MSGALKKKTGTKAGSGSEAKKSQIVKKTAPSGLKKQKTKKRKYDLFSTGCIRQIAKQITPDCIVKVHEAKIISDLATKVLEKTLDQLALIKSQSKSSKTVNKKDARASICMITKPGDLRNHMLNEADKGALLYARKHAKKSAGKPKKEKAEKKQEEAVKN